MTPVPVLPDYGGACLTGVVPALLDRARHDWMPEVVHEARQVVLLVLDGLGWDQLRERAHLAPTLVGMVGGPITSVAPSTTAACLTSIVTGTPPAVHGVVGYRVHVGGGSVMNVLRWRTADGDATATVPPEGFASAVPFRGTAPPVVTRSEFGGGGFTAAHLNGTRLVGWRMPSTLVAHVRRLVACDGEPFVYAYYDGIDKVAHEHGLGDVYDEEVRAADRLVGEVLDALPAGAVLVVTSDHGQVDVGEAVVPIAGEVMDRVAFLSGEGRFRWLHARPGMRPHLADAARAAHGDTAWVRTVDEAVDDGWFGGQLPPHVAARMGDVVLAARDPVAFIDPGDPIENLLRSRHGSLTAAEMWVPLVAAAAKG